MLIFQSLRTSGSDGFMTAFQTTFRIAAAIPAALILVELARHHRQRERARLE
jgi:hypothetical protein